MDLQLQGKRALVTGSTAGIGFAAAAALRREGAAVTVNGRSPGRVAEAVAVHDPLKLAALHVATTLTGSALIALALARGRIDPEAAWRAAHVDEDWQAEIWGQTAEAEARRQARWRDMDAAAFILRTA